MSISAARTCAFDILLQVEKEDAYASELLHSAKYLALSREDHALATQIVMGVLRWRSEIDSALTSASSRSLPKLDAEVRTALRMGAYQLIHLERVPSHAAVHESVELVKRARKTSAAGFVNAVLRKIPRGTRSETPQLATDRTVQALAQRYSHPGWMVARWVERFGVATAEAICNANQHVPVTSIRIRDTHGVTEHGVAERGVAEPTAADWLQDGIRVADGALLASARRVESGDITKSKPFTEGRVVIQDEASQLVALLTGQGVRILDCCAAPGGKTMLIAERNPAATIVAMDIHSHRARLLRARAKASNVHVVAGDLRSPPFRGTFDRIILDAPCSGTGTLAHHPEIKWRLCPEHILELQTLQVSLLQAAMELVPPGGTLLYSTCSMEPEENEGVIDQVGVESHGFQLKNLGETLLQLKKEQLVTANDIQHLTSGPYLRTLPGTDPCDGFFAALLEKLP